MFAAYKYVITWVVMAEASFCAYQLKLPVPQPITQNDIAYEFLPSPADMWPDGAGGRIDAGGYFFSFGTRNRYIVKLHPFPGGTQAEENELLSREKSLVDTNGAYLLASNWLEAIQVDVSALEKAHRHHVWQRRDYQFGLLPVFNVEWGEGEIPLVQVVVDGRKKGLVSIRQEDTSFLRRPTELVRNLEKLLEIPDEEFNRYSYDQCTNLVAQYSVFDYYHPFDKKLSITNRSDVTNDYNAILKKYSSGAIARRRLHQGENVKTNTP